MGEEHLHRFGQVVPSGGQGVEHVEAPVPVLLGLEESIGEVGSGGQEAVGSVESGLGGTDQLREVTA